MLCLECGAEMSLVQVVEDTTMFVSGYEHHTWHCSTCSTLEQRMIFTREKIPTPTVSVEPTQTVLGDPAHPKPSAVMLQLNTWLEKVRSLQEQAKAAREVAREAELRARFNREWDSLLP
jgi:hypothetical protein